MNLPIKLFYLPLLGIIMLSCRSEHCEHIFLPDQYLEDVSLTFESFDTIRTLVYKDIAGDFYRYELDPDLYLFNTILKPDSCEGELIFIQYKPEYYLRKFTSSNNTSIAIVLTVGFLDEEQNFMEDRLVDILKFSVFNENTFGGLLSRICIMTSAREGDLDQQAYNASQFEVQDSVVLLNKTYYHVYKQKQGEPKLFYSPDAGVISFTDNAGAQLVLDHVE